MKKCTRCGKEYPATSEFFTKNKNTKDKLSGWCKNCFRETYRTRYKNNKEELLTVYALYKGEQLIADGTIKEIAKKLGNSEKTIRFFATPSYKKRVSENGRRLVRLGKGV